MLYERDHRTTIHMGIIKARRSRARLLAEWADIVTSEVAYLVSHALAQCLGYPAHSRRFLAQGAFQSPCLVDGCREAQADL